MLLTRCDYTSFVCIGTGFGLPVLIPRHKADGFTRIKPDIAEMVGTYWSAPPDRTGCENYVVEGRYLGGPLQRQTYSYCDGVGITRFDVRTLRGSPSINFTAKLLSPFGLLSKARPAASSDPSVPRDQSG